MGKIIDIDNKKCVSEEDDIEDTRRVSVKGDDYQTHWQLIPKAIRDGVFVMFVILGLVGLVGFFYLYGLLWLKFFDDSYSYSYCFSCILFVMMVGMAMTFVTVCFLCPVIVLVSMLKMLIDYLTNL